MKRSLQRIALGAAFLLTAAAPGLAQQASQSPGDDGATIATVNGKPIPKVRADILVRERTQQGQPDSAQLRQAVRDDLVKREVVVQEAERRGITRNAEIQQQMELARQGVLLRAFLADWARANPIGEDQLKAEYERVKSQMGGNEYKARHVLVETEGEAREIIAKLKKGEKFESLARGSKDPGSKENGGDLGWNSPQTFVKPFPDAMVKLKKGDTTDVPVQTQFGWHVIRVDKVRAVAQGLEDLREEISNQITQDVVNAEVARLRGGARIERFNYDGTPR